MSVMRDAMRRFLLRRMLHVARAAFARHPTPAQMRRITACIAPLIARRESYTTSEPIAVGACRARWIEPSDIATGSVILYLHGGAFMVESRAIHDPLLAAIGRAGGARGLMVDYRLAPENPFPAAVEDCYAAWNFLLSSGIDPGRIVIAGDSAGGNLAVVTAMRARDEGMPQAAGLVLLSPVLDWTFSGASIQRNNGLDPLFRASSVNSFAPYYGAGVDPRDPRLSPLFGDLAGLPPALLMVGSSELLLDDSVRFAARVPESELRIWHDMPHVFPAMRGLAAGDRAISEMGEFIRERTAAAIAGAS
ncbi:MAG: alpha/beta hydrolase [Gammaproteobacteria bacterium]|nr:alpha/beta hydrolase [Gammaproteobacteria bacterium]